MKGQTKARKILAVMAVAAFCAGNTTAQAQDFRSPDILVLGDSQISFGSGPAFVSLLSDLKTTCAANKRQQKTLDQLGDMQVGVIGVRSTSIHSWTARGGAAKGSVCDIDKKWKVNAGTYGVVNKTKNEFVQIGQGRNYQFCSAGKSPFETMFRDDYYAPKLLVLAFMGNAAKRWAKHDDLTRQDVQRLAQQLPKDIPCVFMTTAPAYKQTSTKLRLKAQENIKAALARAGNRCSFVEGLTPDTITAIQGNKSFFRLNKSGGVKDPFHPNKRGALHHLKLRAPAMCEAIFTALAKTGGRS